MKAPEEYLIGSSPQVEENATGSSDYNACPEPYFLNEPFNTEEYATVDENGFFSTSARPLSTFGADVDTASYANLRRMINGRQPLDAIPSGAVRIEEMLNYFDYDYPTPQGSDLFGVQAEVSDCPWNPNTKLLVMGFATEKADYAQTEGSNLVFLVDTSGSMYSVEKLPLLKESLNLLLDQLSGRDTISIVTYSGSEEVICEGVPGNDRRGLKRAVDSLQAGGSTNGQAGLEKAYSIAQRHFIEGGNNRIIMCSDGDLNVGITSTSELHDYVSEKRESGVYLSVLGFGMGNYKDTKMETLADNGNGAYHYIDCLDEARKVFGKDLCANLVTLAKDTKFQVEFNPEQVKGYRQIGYENRALNDEDFRDDTVDAGEVGQGHQITVAYELVLNDSAYEIAVPDLKYQYDQPKTTGASDWLTCQIRYTAVESEKTSEQSLIVDERSFTTSPSDDWLFASAVIESGMIIGQSAYIESSSLSPVLTTLGDIRITDEWKLEFEELMRDLESNHSTGTYYPYLEER